MYYTYLEVSFDTGFADLTYTHGDYEISFHIDPEFHVMRLKIADEEDFDNQLMSAILRHIEKIVANEASFSNLNFPSDMPFAIQTEIRDDVIDTLSDELFYSSDRNWKEIPETEYEKTFHV